MIIAVICIIVVLLIIILWAVFTNNSLIAKKNRVKQCRSGICVVLKQRNNLIPNLVASVKAYMGHENEILTRIADLRSRASNATESEQIKKRYGNVLASVKTECGGGRLPGAEGEPAVPSSSGPDRGHGE